MKPIRKWLRPVLVAVPIVAILIAVAILQPWSSFLGPQAVMAKAYVATSSVQSYRFSVSVFPTTPGQEARLEAEYSSPDHYRVRMRETQQEQIEEFIVIGNNQYVKSSNMSKNMIKAIVAGFSSLLNKDTTLGLMNLLTDIQKLPDEKIDNTEYLHYNGRVDVEKQIADAKRSIQESRDRIGADRPTDEEIDADLEQMRSVNIAIELWIGKKDNLIHQLKQTRQGGFEPSSATFKFYDFNKSIIIEPPLDAQGNLLPDWQIAGSITPDSKQPVFTVSHSINIGGEDPEHRQISFKFYITNTRPEMASNILVTLITKATNELNKPVTLELEPSRLGPVDLKQLEKETYSVTWEYDASQISEVELDKMIQSTTVLARYTTSNGEEKIEQFYGNVPYPTKIPPPSP